jgi:hypothetical protein
MQRTEGIHQPNLINRLTFRFAQSGRAEYEVVSRNWWKFSGGVLRAC